MSRTRPLETLADRVNTTIEANENDLILVIECRGGQHDGTYFGFPYTREQCAKMWPALKAFAESKP